MLPKGLEALHRLQAEEIRKRESAKARKADKSEAKHKAKAKAQTQELTPAQLKAKRQEAERVLGERIKRWKFAVKRFYCAAILREANEEGVDHAAARVALAIMLRVAYGGHADAAAREGVKHALEGDAAARFESERVVGTIWSVRDSLAALSDVAAEFLWPAFADPYAVDDFKVKPQLVDRLVADFALSMTQMWTDLLDGTPVGAELLFDKFLNLHNSDQLRALAQEWDIHIPDSATKSGGIQIIHAKLNERSLKLPSCLVERGAGRGARGAGKKKKGLGARG